MSCPPPSGPSGPSDASGLSGPPDASDPSDPSDASGPPASPPSASDASASAESASPGAPRFGPGAEPRTPPPPGLPEPLLVDDRVVAFDKPSGLLSVPGIGPEKADCLVSRAQEGWPGCRIVHRLDRDTSGVIVMARDAEAHRHLSIEFQERRTLKRYVAVVAGVMEADAGTVDAAIRKDMDHPPLQMIDPEQGRPSITHWSVLERSPDATRVELRPITGRSHQLRLHLQSIGHPILGDDLYAPPAALAAAPRLLLHAEELTFAHPSDGRPVTLRSPAGF
ncbi:MAG: RluA family pseudouridine synthase [Phycisphaerales bacterium]